MHTFANKFNIAMNQERTEVMISLYQNYPFNGDLPVPTKEDGLPANVEVVSNLVVTSSFAKEFAEAILSLMNSNSNEA